MIESSSLMLLLLLRTRASFSIHFRFSYCIRPYFCFGIAYDFT